MTKVVDIKLDRENLIAGVLPRVKFVDRPSYKSSTKEYDMVGILVLVCLSVTSVCLSR